MAKKGSNYTSIDIPNEIIEEFDRILKKEPRYKNRAALMKFALNDWINTYKQASTPMPPMAMKEINRLLDLAIKKKK